MTFSGLLPRKGAAWPSLSIVLIGALLVNASLQARPADSLAAGVSEIGLEATLGHRAFVAGLRAYQNGHIALARRHWEPVALRGHVLAQFNMGLLHESEPANLHNDDARAVFWFRQAAQQGLAEAQHKLALAYARGEGVGQNMPRALRWWLRAARQGNADSQYNLGVMYTLGEGGIERDMSRAARWWRRAALAGDAMAQYNLGTLYVNGDTGRPNPCEALHWWRKSRQNGFDQAAVALRSLLGQNAARQCKTQADGKSAESF